MQPGLKFSCRLLLFFPLLLIACGSPKGDSRKSKAKATVYFLKGDPKEMIRGTSPDPESFITLDNLQQWQGFGIREFEMYRSKNLTQSEVNSQADLEAANSTSAPNQDEDKVSGFEDYQFVKTETGYDYRTNTSGFEKFPVFHFSLRNNRLELTGVRDLPLQAIHYSYAANGRSLSILASAQDPEYGWELIAITFSRNPKSIPRIFAGVTPYEYLLGTGIEAKWNKPANFLLCGISDPKVQTDIRAGIDAWSLATKSAPGSIGSLRYQITVAEVAKPFTDLNQNCITYVQNYRFEKQEEYVELGHTKVLFDPETLDILDTHVFLFPDAVRRAAQSSLIPTATHEIGHALGLGHEFRRDPKTGVILYPSVMGYDGIETITRWDIKAVLSLYPIENKVVF